MLAQKIKEIAIQKILMIKHISKFFIVQGATAYCHMSYLMYHNQYQHIIKNCKEKNHFIKVNK